MRYLFSFTMVCIAMLGCVSLAPMQPVDLQSGGWETRRGQAIWKPKEQAPELVGDFILASRKDGSSYLQFSKTLPIVTARWEPPRWDVEFASEQKRFAGRGAPPKKLGWLQLLWGMEGRELPERWVFTKAPGDSIHLANSHTGERIELHFQK